jgi:uncharacterized protein YmfQ (DUF2313 family)
MPAAGRAPGGALMDALQYREQLQALLPQGGAWPREPGAVLTLLLDGMASELARVDRRGLDLLREADPATTLELLPEWERVAGLPDPCAGPAETVQERRDRLVALLTNPGGQSRQHFVGLAAAYGFAITITEFAVLRAGFRAGARCNGRAWAYAWRVNAPEETVRFFRAGQSFAGERLASWGNAILECVITRARPAHTTVIFAYGG